MKNIEIFINKGGINLFNARKGNTKNKIRKEELI